MRCLSCDCILNDYESTRKYSNGVFVDLCNKCYSYVMDSLYSVADRPDLLGAEDIDIERADNIGDDYA